MKLDFHSCLALMYMTDWDPHSYADLEGLFTKGSWNANFASQVKQEEGDIILTNRQGFNAFDGTNLESILKENNIGSLFVGGFLSNICVEETITYASDIANLDVYSLTDGCAAKSEEEHFVATTGTFPIFSTPVTCYQAINIVRDISDEGKGSSRKNLMSLPSFKNQRTLRESIVRRNGAGERRNTFLHEARHSAYMKFNDVPVAAKNRMSIATMLHYYPEKEEPDEDGFGKIRVLKIFSFLLALEVNPTQGTQLLWQSLSRSCKSNLLHGWLTTLRIQLAQDNVERT